MAMDFTIPFSWIKGTDCVVKSAKDGTESACKKLKSNLKQKLKNIEEEVQ